MIYQLGVGVSDINLSRDFYHGLGFTIIYADVNSEIHEQMTRYTGGKKIKRKSLILGDFDKKGCIELIQPNKGTIGPLNRPSIGDIGIFKIKVSSNVCLEKLIDKNPVLYNQSFSHDGSKDLKKGYGLYDPDDNYLEILESDESKVCGFTIGVNDADKSITYYQNLGFETMSDETLESGDHDTRKYPGGNRKMRKIIMKNQDLEEIEIIQILEQQVNNLFQDRVWGHIGYSHVAFDLKESYFKSGDVKRTIESEEGFRMGSIGCKFIYSEDPDQTLIKFVSLSSYRILGYNLTYSDTVSRYVSYLNLYITKIKDFIAYMVPLLTLRYYKLWKLRQKYYNYFAQNLKHFGVDFNDKDDIMDLAGKLSEHVRENKLMTYGYHKDEDQNVVLEDGSKKKVDDICSCSFFGIRTIPEYKQFVDAEMDGYDIVAKPQAYGARGANGNTQMLCELDDLIAQIFNREAGMCTSSGYLASMTAVQSVCDHDTIILCDKFCHDSLQNGMKIAGSTVVKFAHNDINDAFQKSKGFKNKKIVIVVEGVYSMDATICDLRRVKVLKERLIANGNDVLLIIDEAHSLGILGKNGRGVEELLDMHGTADIICGTFSKAISITGGYIVTTKKIMGNIYPRSSGFIFTCGISTVCAKLIRAGIKTLMAIKDKPGNGIETAHKRAKQFKMIMHKNGVTIGRQLDWKNINISLAPVVVWDEVKLLTMINEMAKKGYLLFGACFPACEIGRALFRVSIRGDMSEGYITDIADKILELLRYHGTIKGPESMDQKSIIESKD